MSKLPAKKGYLQSEGVKRSFDYTEPGKVPTAENLPEEFKKKYEHKLRIRDDRIKLSGDGVFYTVQGEGLSTGLPAVFMRLQFCNLMCTWCWGKGTKILTPNGQVNIEDLKVGDEIISYKDKKYIVDIVKRTFREYAELIKITTEEGIEIKVTPEHIYHNSHRGGGAKKQKAKNLLNKFVVKGIGVPFNYPLQFKNQDERIGYLKGAMLGDGNISKKGNNYGIYWQVCDLDFAEAILKIVNEDLGHNAHITTYKRDLKHKLVYRISFGTNKSAELLKEMPINIDQLRGYIAGFFDAEGCTSRNQLIITQQSHIVLKRIQNLLHSFGFISTYSAGHAQRADAIVINGKEQLEKFFHLFPIQIKRKIDKFVQVPRTNVSVKVVKIEPYYPDLTFLSYGLQTNFGKVFADGYLSYL